MAKPTVEQLCEFFRQIEAGIVTHASLQDFLGQGKPAESDTTGLEIVEIEVNGDDSRWGKIIRNEYAHCDDGNPRTGDFPVKPGKRVVKVALFPANYFPGNPSNEQIIVEIARRSLMRPDRAITETLLDSRSKAELAESPIVGICGLVQSDADGSSVVGCIRGSADGRSLLLSHPQGWWRRSCRFAAVVSE